jgi:hypothetical protein
VRIQTETNKIQQYRQRLRQALDVFGVSHSANCNARYLADSVSFSFNRASRYMKRSFRYSRKSGNEIYSRRKIQRHPLQAVRAQQTIRLAICCTAISPGTSR